MYKRAFPSLMHRSLFHNSPLASALSHHPKMSYEGYHEHPQGPGDARPTALDIIRDENLVGKLVGRAILITGGSSGLGLEAARALFVHTGSL